MSITTEKIIEEQRKVQKENLESIEYKDNLEELEDFPQERNLIQQRKELRKHFSARRSDT